MGVVGSKLDVAIQYGQSIDHDARVDHAVAHRGRGTSRVVAAVARNVDHSSPALKSVALENAGGELELATVWFAAAVVQSLQRVFVVVSPGVIQFYWHL